MTKCDVCKDTIEHGQSQLGPPFIEGVRHMKCQPKCNKCGLMFATEMGLHEHTCGESL